MVSQNLNPKQLLRTHLFTQLIAHLRIPLYRNGYALILGAGMTSVLGLLYWILAARYYPAEVVGLSSAVISAMMLLSGTAMFSFTGVLVRFTPLAGARTARFIRVTYGISAITAAIISFAFTQYGSLWSPQFQFLQSDRAWTVAFVLATVTWSTFSLQDSALTGLRQALWIPLENTIFALAKIVFLLLFVQLAPLWGIFAAWVIPVVVSLLPMNLLIFRYLIPKHVQQSTYREGALSRAAIFRYVLGNYPGTLFYLAATTLLPLIVTQQAGVQANAYFYMPWMITGALQQVALNMTTSLTVEAATDQKSLNLYCYRALRQSARIVLPLVLLFIGGASFILSIFGEEYAVQGTLLLRLLAFAAIPNIVVMLYIGLARVKNLVRNIVLIQGAQSIFLLMLSYLFLPMYGITGVGIALLISQSSVAALLFFSELRSVLQAGRMAHQRVQIEASKGSE